MVLKKLFNFELSNSFFQFYNKILFIINNGRAYSIYFIWCIFFGFFSSNADNLYNAATSNKAKCCLKKLFNCLIDPFTLSGTLGSWEGAGWIYPANIPDYGYLGKSAVQFNWKWTEKKLSNSAIGTLKKIAPFISAYEASKCFIDFSKCLK